MGSHNPRREITITNLDYGTSAVIRMMELKKGNVGYISEGQIYRAREKLCGHGLRAKCKCAKPQDILRPYIVDSAYQNRGILVTLDIPNHVAGGRGLHTLSELSKRIEREDGMQVDFGG